MNIQDALRSKKPMRRKSWVTKEFLLSELITFDENDILATDWEVEEDKPTKIEIKADEYNFLKMENVRDNEIEIMMADTNNYGLGYNYCCFVAEEADIDKLLTFLYNNTEIGKKRVIPF